MRDQNLDALSAVEDRIFRLKRDRKLDKGVETLEGIERPMVGQLPSWVPDWQVHSPSSPFILHPAFPTMKAAGSTQASCSISVDSLTLFCRGLAFDQVRHVGNDFTETVPAPGSLSLKMTQIRPSRLLLARLAQGELDRVLEYRMELRVRQWDKMARDLKTYPTGEDVLDAFIKSLVANDPLFLGLLRERLRAYYTAWRRYWRTAGVKDPKLIHSTYERSAAEEIELANRFLQGQLKAAYGRRFFTTSKGYMGLCQSATPIGHTVVILHGGKTPYLLQGTGKRGYRFVGEFYIHGLMNGKALTESIAEQVFAIR